VVVNSLGDVRDPRPAQPRIPAPGGGPVEATTIGVVATNAALGKAACLRVAEAGHDGLARALDPVHTAADGDAIVAAATGPVAAPVETVRALAAWALERAVLDAAAAADTT
jgi:L-aminopeptidase/D-esterase-like protein